MNFLQSFRAVFESGVSATEQAVLLALIDHMPDCRPSVSRIARWAKVTERSVFLALKALKAQGIVSVHQTMGKPSSYSLDLSRLPSAATPEPGSPLNDVHPCNSFRPPLNDVQTTPEPDSPKGTKEGSKEGSIPKTRNPSSGTTSKKSQTSKAGSARPKVRTDSPDPRVNEIKAHYRSTFEAEFGKPPLESHQKDGACVKAALRQVSAEELKRAITVQLTERRHDTFAPGKATSLYQIVSATQLNNIFAWKASPKGPAKAAPPPMGMGEAAPRIIRTRADLQ